MAEVVLEILQILEELELNQFTLRKTPGGQTDLMLNDNLLITSINDDEEKSSVLERIISESVTIREILDEAEDKIEDYVLKVDKKIIWSVVLVFLEAKRNPIYNVWGLKFIYFPWSSFSRLSEVFNVWISSLTFSESLACNAFAII